MQATQGELQCTDQDQQSLPKMSDECSDGPSSLRSTTSPPYTLHHLPIVDNIPDEKRPALENEDLPKMSTIRMFILGIVMTLTYYIASATSASSLMIIPAMSKDLQVSELAVQWVASAFTLGNGCGILVSGRLADIYGRKYLFLIGLSINAVFSLASGFVRVLIPLCVLRAIAGIGLAIAMPSAFGIIGTTFPVEPTRTIAFACMGVGYPLGSGTGQVFGGLIAGINEHSWQYQFFFLAGIAAIAVAVGIIVIPNIKSPKSPGTPPEKPNKSVAMLSSAMSSSTAVETGGLATDTEDITQMPMVDAGERKAGRIDWLGAVVITAAITLLNFSITQSGLTPKGWKEPYVPVLFVVSILLFFAFGFWERHVKSNTALEPLIDLAVFRKHNWRVTALLCSSFTAYCAINGWVYMTSTWFQNLKGDTPIQYALHTLPAPIVGIFACLIVPVVATRVRAPILLIFGGLSTSAACWLFIVEPPGLTYWACEFLANIVNPFGADFTVGIGSVLISNFAESHEQSLLGGLFQTAIAFSGTISVCLCSLIQEEVYNSTGDLRKALHGGFWLLSAFAWLSCIIVFLFLRHIGLAKDVKRDDQADITHSNTSRSEKPISN